LTGPEAETFAAQLFHASDDIQSTAPSTGRSASSSHARWSALPTLIQPGVGLEAVCWNATDVVAQHNVDKLEARVRVGGGSRIIQ
jgi:hypothetical protein